MSKKLFVIMALLLMLCAPAFAQVRLQTAGCVLARSDGSPEYNYRFGVSKELFNTENGSALYSIVFGKYGSEVRGGDIEFAFFPSKPIGKGFRLFFVAGSNYTVVNEAEFDPITYIQFTSGMGAYWEFSTTSAIWGAFKLEQSENLQTVHAGIGLSTALF